MEETDMKQQKYEVTRGKILLSFIIIAVFGLLFGYAMQSLLKDTLGLSQSNITICMLIFILIVEILWLPFALNTSKCMEYHESYLAYLPKYGHFKKLKIIFQLLLSAQIEDFYEKLYWKDVNKVKFTFERKWGTWGYSRYTMQMYFLMKNNEIKMFVINPMENGYMMPSSFGGLPIFSGSSHEDIINVLQYMKTCGVIIEDPYHLQEALKNPNITMYEYMETLDKPYKF